MYGSRTNWMAFQGGTTQPRWPVAALIAVPMAEPIFSWEPAQPRPWWKFWGKVPQPPELVAPAHDRQIMG